MITRHTTSVNHMLNNFRGSSLSVFRHQCQVKFISNWCENTCVSPQEFTYVSTTPASTARNANRFLSKLYGKLSCNLLFENQKRTIQTSSVVRREDSLMIWQNVKELKSSPAPALTLGLSGLLPFIAAPGYMVLSQTYLPYLATVQLFYGATILSFLGGVRWGLTLPENGVTQPNWFNLIYSVTPPLIAWTGLMLPLPYSTLTMILGLAGAGYYDIMLYGYPSWFKGLRFVLTFVAVLSLWSTFMCSLMLKSHDEEAEEKQ